MASGKRKSTTDGKTVELSEKKYPFDSRFDVGLKFGLGKLAPVPRLAVELAMGQTLFGEEITPGSTAFNNIVPLYLQDLGDAIDEFGPEALFTVGTPGFFGVGTQTYTKPKKKGGRFSTF